ncbi:hypothetical protein ACFL4D_02640 [Candidatus Margulisiibacteriota bacterium]
MISPFFDLAFNGNYTIVEINEMLGTDFSSMEELNKQMDINGDGLLDKKDRTILFNMKLLEELIEAEEERRDKQAFEKKMQQKETKDKELKNDINKIWDQNRIEELKDMNMDTSGTWTLVSGSFQGGMAKANCPTS